MTGSPLLNAIVKSVLSVDTLILRGQTTPTHPIPKERVFHLEGIQAVGRSGGRDQPDQLWYFESREYLRLLLVGRPISFKLLSAPTATSNEFGIAYTAAGVDIALEIVKAGWGIVREIKNADEDDPRRISLRAAEVEAKAAAKGKWSLPLYRDIRTSMPEDPVEFLAEFKNRPIEAVVESVSNGASARIRLLFSPTLQQFINLRLAGINAPRTQNANGEGGEPFGDEAKFFLESRILQRTIHVTLLSLPTPTSTQSFMDPSATPPVATAFLGTIQHPAGNISALLVGTGLVSIIDWHAGFLGPEMVPLRKAEAEAKAARRGQWSSLPALASVSHNATNGNGSAAANMAAQQQKTKAFEGVVTRVWGADLLSILPVGSEVERRIQLSSIRQPKPSGNFAGLQAEGKELLRKKLIGKTVHVTIDYIKPAEGAYDAQECATIKINGLNIATQLVHKGLVSVVRHRAGEDKSSCYDELLVAEVKATGEKKGIHGGVDVAAARALVDASESATKAAPFLSTFKRGGRTAATIEYVASGSRFKVIVPKYNCKITLVLGGIRCPRTARNAGEKSEPFGPEALTFSSRLLLQRDVEITIESVDRTGGFIGTIYSGGVDVAEILAREGLARLDQYASVGKALMDAEEVAKSQRKNIWKAYDAEAEAESNNIQVVESLPTKKEYLDVVVSDIRGDKDTPFSFAVQVLRANGIIPELEQLMSELNTSMSTVAPGSFVPRHNDLVSAQFSADNVWYRARVRKCNPATKQCEVVYIDYGNTELLHWSRLQPLASEFKSLEPSSREAQLSFVTLLDPTSSDYGVEALDRFREYCEDRALVACVDFKEGSGLLHLSLFDPKLSTDESINISLVKDGLARVDTKSRLREIAPKQALAAATTEAKRSRSGAYELGDVFDD